MNATQKKQLKDWINSKNVNGNNRFSAEQFSQELPNKIEEIFQTDLTEGQKEEITTWLQYQTYSGEGGEENYLDLEEMNRYLPTKTGEIMNTTIEIDEGYLKKIQATARANGWSDIELEHALENLDNQYEKECVVKIANGREIRTPAHPEECNYVRITQLGYELAYWTSDEWADDPECVMGAIIGCAHG